MAFYDWNHDGKEDWQDNYIEYNIYKYSTGKMILHRDILQEEAVRL